MAKEFKYEIINSIGVLSENNSWKKELNRISWNGNEPKYDIRDWSDNHEKMGKGITLSEDELRKLKEIIDEGYIENYKDLLEECICLNESVFLKDKSIRIRKVDFDGENIWIGEWEEMNDRMRDGMVGYYRFGVSGQKVLNEIENNKNCGRDWVKM